MSKRYIIGLFFLFLASSLFAQEKWSYPEVDAHSYELYQQNKWDDLIQYASKSREHGIDFFIYRHVPELPIIT